MSETLRDGTPEIPIREYSDPIGSLSKHYDGLLSQIYSAEEELVRVESERATAIRNAEAPFEPKIKELQSKIGKITMQQGAEFGRILLEESLVETTPLYRTALELLVHKYWGEQGIEGLIQTIATENRRHSPDGLLAIIKGQLRGISALEGVLSATNGPQPVLVYGLHRYEERDEQAEWEGRDSHTGIFTTEAFGYSGIVATDSLTVEDESFLLPGQFGYLKRPAALLLHMSGVKVFQTQPDWTIENFDREITEDGSLTVALLSRKSKDSPRKPMLIEWSPKNMTPDKNICIAVGQEQIQKSTELISQKTGTRRVR